MELQRMKLENIKNRILRGEPVKGTRVENGEYIVQMATGPEITFDDDYRPTVDKTIEKAKSGVREDALGNNTTLNSIRERGGDPAARD